MLCWRVDLLPIVYMCLYMLNPQTLHICEFFLELICGAGWITEERRGLLRDNKPLLIFTYDIDLHNWFYIYT